MRNITSNWLLTTWYATWHGVSCRDMDPHFDLFLLWYKGTLSVLLAYHCIIQYKVYYVKSIFGTLYCINMHCINIGL